MSLQSLSLTHFRNISQARIALSAHLTLIVGANGQGKTNILESIYLVLQGRDFRTTNEREIIQHGSEFAALEGMGELLGRPQRWQHRTPSQAARRVHTGSIAPVVLFAPDDVYLAKGSPERRRRFLDLLLSAHDARYARALRAYHRTVLQRNRALKEAAFQQVVEDFTPLLVREGLYLWNRRRETLDSLRPRAQAIHAQIASGEELAFRLEYGGTPHEIHDEVRYAAEIQRRRPEERQRLVTLVGPHRDDIVMTINGLDTKTYASQGQLRTLALSIKLATYEWLRHETGVRPVILLDDVLSELDERRRQAILQTVAEPGQQTVVTDTEPRSYQALEPLILSVQAGEVEPWNPLMSSG